MFGHRAILYVTALAMCISAVWFVASPSVPPALAFLTALAGFIRTERETAAKVESIEDQNDRKLLAALRRELPRQPTIDFFQRADFLIDFERAPVRNLETFTRDWDNEEHRFFDSKLETCRTKLLAAAQRCLNLIPKYATVEENDLWRIRTMDQRHNRETEAMWREQAREIAGFSTKVSQHYDDMIRYGRSRFPDESAD